VQGKLFWLALDGQRIASKDVKLNDTVSEMVARAAWIANVPQTKQ
jgi:hypothetical protein